MKLFRLSAENFSRDLSGKGAEKTGGRWNSRGVAVIYTSESRALCTAEIAVHTHLSNLPVNYRLITITIPDDTLIAEIKPSQLPDDWKAFPHSHSTQKIGDDFIKSEKSLIFKVPSSVVPGDFNYLINPNHKDFDKVEIERVEEFEFDKRLFYHQ